MNIHVIKRPAKEKMVPCFFVKFDAGRTGIDANEGKDSANIANA
jgi:hypothetical protein